MNRFGMQVSQLLSTYQTKYKTQPINSLLISSALPNIDNIVSNIQEELSGVSIEIFDALKKITIPENLKEKATAEPNSSVFSTVLGLATRRLDVFGHYEYVTGTNNINLLPNRESVKNQEKIKLLSRWGVVIFVALAILLATWTFFSDGVDIVEGEKQVAEYNDLKKQKNDKMVILNKLKKARENLYGMLEASKNITSNQEFMYTVLQGINSSAPPGISLSSIDYSNAVITIKGLSIDISEMKKFIDALTATKPIDKASLLTMSVKMENKYEFKSFSIKCTLVAQKTVNEKEKSNDN
jgi:type IV pilus assembly protein PilN